MSNGNCCCIGCVRLGPSPELRLPDPDALTKAVKKALEQDPVPYSEYLKEITK